MINVNSLFLATSLLMAFSSHVGNCQLFGFTIPSFSIPGGVTLLPTFPTIPTGLPIPLPTPSTSKPGSGPLKCWSGQRFNLSGFSLPVPLVQESGCHYCMRMNVLVTTDQIQRLTTIGLPPVSGVFYICSKGEQNTIAPVVPGILDQVVDYINETVGCVDTSAVLRPKQGGIIKICSCCRDNCNAIDNEDQCGYTFVKSTIADQLTALSLQFFNLFANNALQILSPDQMFVKSTASSSNHFFSAFSPQQKHSSSFSFSFYSIANIFNNNHNLSFVLFYIFFIIFALL